MKRNGGRSLKHTLPPSGNSKDINRIFAEGTLVDEAVWNATREAILDHKRAGNPICIWRDGKRS